MFILHDPDLVIVLVDSGFQFIIFFDHTMHRFSQFDNISDFVPESTHRLIELRHTHAQFADFSLDRDYNRLESVATSADFSIDQIL